MFAPKESKTLRTNLKRLGWFLLFAFCVCLPECYLLVYYAKISAALNGVIVVCTAGVMYLIFLLICHNIDKKRARHQVENSAKDPFKKQ